MRSGAKKSCGVIPGRRAAVGPESIATLSQDSGTSAYCRDRIMDSGLAGFARSGMTITQTP